MIASENRQPSKLKVAGSNLAGVAIVPNRAFIPTKLERNAAPEAPPSFGAA